MASPAVAAPDISPPSETQKRKAGELPPEATAGKRRAARACLSCRGRKVRCDAVTGGVPCTNCRLDGVVCAFTESNRGRVCTSIDGDDPCPRSRDVTENDLPVNDLPVALSFEGARGLTSRPHSPERRNHDAALCNSPITTSANEGGHLSPLDRDRLQQRLPSYIRPLPSRISPDDIEYLTKKGALLIPDPELQRELLRAYFLYAHPLMPIIDIPLFIAPITRPKSDTQPLSLILFQAVMAMGVAFVDIEYLTSRGYQSRKAARTAFFDRPRLLYGLDCEADHLALIQALLLMTYWYARPEDEKETWHWLGIALSLAQIQGLHRNPEVLNIRPTVARLRKRIWWSCFIRDRLLALGIRRPIRIRSNDFSVSMLTLADFEVEAWSEDVLNYLGPFSTTSMVTTQQNMSLLCIELAKLCVNIGDVLSTQYSILGSPDAFREDSLTTMVMPMRSAEQMEDMIRCDAGLTEWYQGLHPACRPQLGSSPTAEEQTDAQMAYRLHLALLHMMYHTAVTVLHRPRALQSARQTHEESAVHLSRQRITEAAVTITGLIYELDTSNSLRHCSTSTITALLAATMIHLIDVRSVKEDIRNRSIGRFYHCWEALQQLRDMYASADYAVWFVETAIRQSKLHIPMLARPTLSLGPFSRRGQDSLDSHPAMPFNVTTSSSSNANPSSGFSTARRGGDALSSDMIVVYGPGTGNAGLGPFGRQPFDYVHTPKDVNAQTSTSSTSLAAGSWNDLELDNDLLQALINFDANPAYLPMNEISTFGVSTPQMGQLGHFSTA